MLLCLLVPALAACGGSSSNVLIPKAEANPLRADFATVAESAEEGHGDCEDTNDAIKHTEEDFLQLSHTVDMGLRERLTEGISNLSEEARARCAEGAEKKKPPKHEETSTVETEPPPVETVEEEVTPPVETVETEEIEEPEETEEVLPSEETGGVEPTEGEVELEGEGEEGEEVQETEVPPTEPGGIVPGGGVEPPS